MHTLILSAEVITEVITEVIKSKFEYLPLTCSTAARRPAGTVLKHIFSMRIAHVASVASKQGALSVPRREPCCWAWLGVRNVNVTEGGLGAGKKYGAQRT